jgi:hypothetical protein
MVICFGPRRRRALPLEIYSLGLRARGQEPMPAAAAAAVLTGDNLLYTSLSLSLSLLLHFIPLFAFNCSGRFYIAICSTLPILKGTSTFVCSAA